MEIDKRIFKKAIKIVNDHSAFYNIDVKTPSALSEEDAKKEEGWGRLEHAFTKRLFQAGHLAFENRDSEKVPEEFVKALEIALEDYKKVMKNRGLCIKDMKLADRKIDGLIFLKEHPNEAFQAILYWLKKSGCLK